MNVAPVALVVVYVILFIGEFKQAVWMLLADVSVIVLRGLTVTVAAPTVAQPFWLVAVRV